MNIEKLFEQIIKNDEMHIVVRDNYEKIIFSSDAIAIELSEKHNKKTRCIKLNNNWYMLKKVKADNNIIETYYKISEYIALLKKAGINIIVKNLDQDIIFSTTTKANILNNSFNGSEKEKYIPKLNNWYQYDRFLSGDYIIEKYTVVTQYIEKNNELKHDVLTGLYNRHGILEQLELLKDKITTDEFIIIIGDIDFFKYVNDNYGHNVGDVVLKSIGDILNETVENGFCGRYGGEEFLIVLDTNDIEEAYLTVENIRKILEETDFLVEDKKINLTMSFGISKFKKDECKNMNHQMCITDIVKNADIALMTSKQTGRNKTLIYEEGMLNKLLDEEL